MSWPYSWGRPRVEWLLKKHESTPRGTGHVRAGHLQWSTNQTTNPPSSWSFLQTVLCYSNLMWSVRLVRINHECVHGVLKVKNEESAIIHSPSCCFRPVWLTFFREKKKNLFVQTMKGNWLFIGSFIDCPITLPNLPFCPTNKPDK